VLVVDDDESMRQLVGAALVNEGFEVNEAVSGSDLVWVLNSIIADAGPSDGVDLIVLDLRMPGMNGLEIVRKLRDARWRTPAILMTAFPDPEVLTEANRLGVPVLSKPFSLEALTRMAVTLLLHRDNVDPENMTQGLKATS
jgi:two-component system response regulator (stage 0 sporulation protein F)